VPNHLRLIATGTWREITLPNGNPALYFDYPQAVLNEADVWSLQTYEAYAVQDGYVRHLWVVPPAVQQPSLLALDSVARESVINAMKKTAAACFNPASYEVGARLTATYRYFWSFGGENDQFYEAEVKEPVEFEGGFAYQLAEQYGPPGGPADSEVKYFDVDFSKKQITQFGTKVVETSWVPDHLKEQVYTPGKLFRFDLKEGESFTQTYTTTTSPEVQINTSVTTTFVGIESVSVPKGTYQACRFNDGDRSIWYEVGTGVKLKTLETSGTSIELVTSSGKGFAF
jgi:hypothetical protein